LTRSRRSVAVFPPRRRPSRSNHRRTGGNEATSTLTDTGSARATESRRSIRFRDRRRRPNHQRRAHRLPARRTSCDTPPTVVPPAGPQTSARCRGPPTRDASCSPPVVAVDQVRVARLDGGQRLEAALLEQLDLGRALGEGHQRRRGIGVDAEHAAPVLARPMLRARGERAVLGPHPGDGACARGFQAREDQLAELTQRMQQQRTVVGDPATRGGCTRMPRWATYQRLAFASGTSG